MSGGKSPGVDVDGKGRVKDWVTSIASVNITVLVSGMDPLHNR